MLNKYMVEFRLLVILALTMLIIFGLIEARAFLIPVCVAGLMAYLLYPLASKLESWGVHRIPANLIVIILALMVLIAIIFGLYTQVTKFVNDVPQITEQALENIEKIEESLSAMGGQMGMNSGDGWLKTRLKELINFSGEFFRKMFTATASFFAGFALLPIYIFLLLYYREKFRTFLLMLIPERHHHQLNIVLTQVQIITPSYMGGLLIVVTILAVLNSVGLLIAGIHYAVFFGVLAAIMNLIPYIGTIIGAAIPLTYALVAMDSPRYALSVLILFIIIQFTENNILTPNITGSKVNINPLVTIMTVVVGGMIWGIAGMFIFLPYVAMLKIVCENVDSLKPYAFLMGVRGTERYALSFEKIKHFFQKMRSKS